MEKGIFTLQLHGLEHYWPAALMADQSKEVREWLLNSSPQSTEQLPSHLQSRWTDASVLPSRPLPEKAICSVVSEETVLFQKIFGFHPSVAVPTTFVWDTTVEAALAKNGVKFVVTPGIRNTCRGANGKPGCTGARIYNAEAGQGVVYLVRNDYFEPMLGHTADKALADLAAKTKLGRPCLLETHRSNFVDGEELAKQSMKELSHLLQSALETYPTLRFISTEALGRALLERDPEWVERCQGPRLAILVKRLKEVPRLGKLTHLSGLSIILSSLATLCGHKKEIPET